MVKGAYEGTFDVAVLVSGDGDFVPAVKVVQKKGKSVENAYFKPSISWHLKQECDKSIRLTKELLDVCFRLANQRIESLSFLVKDANSSIFLPSVDE